MRLMLVRSVPQAAWKTERSTVGVEPAADHRSSVDIYRRPIGRREGPASVGPPRVKPAASRPAYARLGAARHQAMPNQGDCSEHHSQPTQCAYHVWPSHFNSPERSLGAVRPSQHCTPIQLNRQIVGRFRAGLRTRESQFSGLPSISRCTRPWPWLACEPFKDLAVGCATA